MVMTRIRNDGIFHLHITLEYEIDEVDQAVKALGGEKAAIMRDIVLLFCRAVNSGKTSVLPDNRKAIEINNDSLPLKITSDYRFRLAA